MINLNIFDFLKYHSSVLYVLNCSSEYEYTHDLLDTILVARYYKSDIDLGITCLTSNKKKDFLIVDGKRRILSVILLLKAISLHLKQEKEEMNAISNEIDSKCLFFNGRIKLNLFGIEKHIFESIINDEILTYNDKQSEIYKTYEMFKEDLMTCDIEELYSLMSRLRITVSELDEPKDRDIFYMINKENRELNQTLLIKSYFSDINHKEFIDNLLNIFNNDTDFLIVFFYAYLSSKFNYSINSPNDIYYYFVKYYEMLSKFQSYKEFNQNIFKTAKIYKKLNMAEYNDKQIRNGLIKLISNEGKDTFSYLLDIFDDYENKLLDKNIVLEVLDILNTYVNERNTSISYYQLNLSKIAEELNEVICKSKEEN